MRTACAQHAHSMRTACARHVHHVHGRRFRLSPLFLLPLAEQTPCAHRARTVRAPCRRHLLSHTRCRRRRGASTCMSFRLPSATPSTVSTRSPCSRMPCAAEPGLGAEHAKSANSAGPQSRTAASHLGPGWLGGSVARWLVPMRGAARRVGCQLPQEISWRAVVGLWRPQDGGSTALRDRTLSQRWRRSAISPAVRLRG